MMKFFPVVEIFKGRGEQPLQTRVFVCKKDLSDAVFPFVKVKWTKELKNEKEFMEVLVVLMYGLADDSVIQSYYSEFRDRQKKYRAKKRLERIIDKWSGVYLEIKRGYRITIEGTQVKCFDVAFNPIYVESND